MKLSTRRAVPALTITLALLATAACGGSDGGDDPGGDAAGGTLTAAGPIPIENLDPHGPSSMDAGTQLAARALFSQLVVSTGPGEFTGDLATEWEPDDDTSEWTFTLRDGVEFSDGEPVDADAVVASFERVLELQGPLAGNFVDYQVEAPDESTVVFDAGKPDASFVAKISSFFVTPPDVDESFFQDPVGSGPFVVESFEPGQTLRMTPNPTYWDGPPALEELVFQSIPEVSARMTALQTGEVDVTWAMPDDQIPALQGDTSITVESVDSPGVLTMWMNSSEETLKEAAVRRALWQAVDFDEITTSLFPETGSPADSVVSPVVLGYAPQEPVAYDPQAAKAALDAAGFDYDTKLRMQFSQPQFRQLAQAVASDLAEIGVQVEPLEKEQAVFLEDLLALKWDLNIQQIGSQGYDAATNLGRLYPCAAGRTGYCNEDLDELLAAAEATSDTAEREDLYAQATQIVWDDAVGMYPMFVGMPYAWRSGVEGFVPASDSLPYFTRVTNSES
ncbi:ABC transporter substrate-binding protein [Promicromonospora sp. NPDC059942]|uniref:ABC transporter substrate-binding protein n=1 Tax=Promicromonospora sp. NPDC059942 TaxID=3347009 RepID=UPI00365641D5